ncbi:unnamed protein product [Cercospora beticola]|nr:unnamed protein product [Cercospora beticola]
MDLQAVEEMRTPTESEATPESPLLALPPELRTRIYHYVIGGQNIHISSHMILAEDLEVMNSPSYGYTYRDNAQRFLARDQRVRFFYTLCDVPHDDDEAYKQSCTPRIDKNGQHLNAVAPYRSRHATCFKHLGPFTSGPSQYKLHLQLLRTCRQIHQEAALMLYNDNIFSFLREKDALQFLDLALHRRQKRALRSIVLFEDYVVDNRYYATAHPAKDFNNMPKLRDVSIFIDDFMCIDVSDCPRFPSPKTVVKAVIGRPDPDEDPYVHRNLAEELEELSKVPEKVWEAVYDCYCDHPDLADLSFDEWLRRKGWIKATLRWFEGEKAAGRTHKRTGYCNCPSAICRMFDTPQSIRAAAAAADAEGL